MTTLPAFTEPRFAIQRRDDSKAAEVPLTLADRAVLEARVRAPTTEQRDVFCARIILMASEGKSTRSIARTLGNMPRTVQLAWPVRPRGAGWIERQSASRTDADLRRRDRSAHSGGVRPPAGFAPWTGPLIAAELGDVHKQYVWRFKAASVQMPRSE